MGKVDLAIKKLYGVLGQNMCMPRCIVEIIFDYVENDFAYRIITPLVHKKRFLFDKLSWEIIFARSNYVIISVGRLLNEYFDYPNQKMFSIIRHISDMIKLLDNHDLFYRGLINSNVMTYDKTNPDSMSYFDLATTAAQKISDYFANHIESMSLKLA